MGSRYHVLSSENASSFVRGSHCSLKKACAGYCSIREGFAVTVQDAIDAVWATTISDPNINQ